MARGDPQVKFFPLRGGLNMISAPIETPPGHVLACMNYISGDRGYDRIPGYERFDGQPKPSEASYWVLNFTLGSAAISEGDTVAGLTSGDTGKALIDAVVTSGSYGGGDAAGYLVLTGCTGIFQDNEELQVSAATKCHADGTALEQGAGNDTDADTWNQDAIETARALISACPGSGPVRGTWSYKGATYAIRDNAGGTAAVLYKSTTAGWVAQSLGYYLAFTSGGTYEIAEGDTIAGHTSGATATVSRVVVTSGGWGTGDAAGYLVFTAKTGTFQAEDLDVGANLNVATIAGDATANTLNPGGHYDIEVANFYGASNFTRTYAAGGVGYAFEWDGTVFAPIITGMPTDTPTHLAVHKNYLFLAFPGGSLQNSTVGEPLTFDPVLGTNEIGIGQDITALIGQVAGALVVLGRNTTKILYGSSTSDFALTDFNPEAGGVEWTAQMMGQPMYLDNRGVRNLSTTQAYGNFLLGTLTQMVAPLLAAKKKAGITPTASIRIRARSEYRLFFSDGTGLSIYLGRQTPECMTFDYGVVVNCAWSGEDANGDEILFFGSGADGMVYQMDAGTSFDGTEVTAFIRLPFYHAGTPSQNKRWQKGIVELDGNPSVSLGVLAEYSYGDYNQPPSQEISFTVTGGGGFWDAAYWDQFYWSSPVEGRAQAHIDGTGETVSMCLVTDGTYDPVHTMHGLTLHFTYRGQVK